MDNRTFILEGKRRHGQAAIEFAIGAFVLVMIISALIGLSRVFLVGIQMQSQVRCDAGEAALSDSDGSESLGGAHAITSRAHPPIEEVQGNFNPWSYPVAIMPGEQHFTEWQSDNVTSIKTIPGFAKRQFRFRMTLGNKTLIDDYGHLAEEVHIPAMGIIRQNGGSP